MSGKSWQKLRRAFWIFALAIALSMSAVSCNRDNATTKLLIPSNQLIAQAGDITEVSPPEAIQTLRRDLEIYQPQVTIVSPEADEVIQDDQVELSLQIQDLPVFKNSELELGPHLHAIVDNQPYIAIYDLNKPLTLTDLEPGTHTLRVFAARPWHESFKNAGAYAQTTFHVFTKTQNNNPDSALPLLTYSRPKGTYGAEPVLLDFYLTNAPLRLTATEKSQSNIADWRIRCTINGHSFVLDSWQSVYLKGFKPGKNWVQLEFIDGQGKSVKNVFNDTVRTITYNPNTKDTLSKLVKGEISADAAQGIVRQNDPVKMPIPTPESLPIPSETPSPVPTPESLPIPSETPSPALLIPENKAKEVKPSGSQKLKSYFNRLRNTNPENTSSPSIPEITDTSAEIPHPSLVPEIPDTNP